jgi:hypothetical protein
MSRNTDPKKVFGEGLVTWAHLSHSNILPIYGAVLEGEGGPVSLVSPQMMKGTIVEYTKTLPQAKRMPLVCFFHSSFCP